KGEQRFADDVLVYAGARRGNLAHEGVAVGERIGKATAQAVDGEVQRRVGRKLAAEDHALRAGADGRTAAFYQDFTGPGRGERYLPAFDPPFRRMDEGARV